MADVRRGKVVKVRWTLEEYEALRARSPKARLAEWRREHCLTPDGARRQPRKAAPPSVDPALLRQLTGIGNNLNQIARRINSGQWSGLDRVHVISALSAIERELAALKDEHQ